MNARRKVSLDDKYTLQTGRILLTGTQALVRLPMVQKERDAKAGLNTGGFISGYRGSPIGTYDTALWRAEKQLQKNGIKFVPGVNEDLAATACWGTQQLANYGEAEVDGVFAIWYGKGPGVDRSGDAIKHGNYSGTHPNGGVLAVFGDDHPGKSSTIAHQSEMAMAANSLPVLYPATVNDFLRFGLIGWAMSRHSGLWTSFKAVNETLERTETVDLEDLEIVIPEGDPMPPEGVHFTAERLGPVVMEKLVKRFRLPRAVSLARANKVDEVIVHGAPRRLGIVTAGKSYLDVRRALSLLGLDLQKAEALGIGLYKVGMIWPLEPEGLREFAAGYDELLFVEEKAAFMEQQAGRILYDLKDRPAISGKETPQGESLLPVDINLEAIDIARVIAGRAEALGLETEDFFERLKTQCPRAGQQEEAPAMSARTPFFCAGCPHNTSTRVPEGSVALAGIGCHAIASYYRTDTRRPTHMGGEGANWIGTAPFTKTKHVFQNVGDGTYYHSGHMAIRAAVAAGVNITFKILFNDAVAMTGGQPVDGPMSVGAITHLMKAEGAREIAVVSDNPKAVKANNNLAAGVTVHHRNHLDSVQQRMREIEGVTVIIYEQTCAAEKRRRRRRGTIEDPKKRVFIHPEICEGCGDCSVESNCLAVAPLETERGEKRRIDQSACNKDYSCVNGLCPSFVSVSDADLKLPQAADLTDEVFAGIPLPSTALKGRSHAVMITGVGGTGVVTIGAVLSMAALVDGNYATCYDMTGLSQKGGAVYSHLRIAREKDELLSSKLGAGDADLLLAFDLLAAQAQEAFQTVRKGRTQLVGNSTIMPTALHTLIAGLKLDASGPAQELAEAVGGDKIHLVNAGGVAVQIMGDSIGGNMFLLGYAAQLGLLPVSVEALREAIRLNGTAVDFNMRALDLGRLYAHDPQRLQPYLSDEKKVETSEKTLDDVLAREMEWLTAYQNRAYAERYRNLVDLARKADKGAEQGRPEFALAVAETFSQLMAYKDEYEVARLYTETDFLDDIKAKFQGNPKVRLHLAPPILGRKDSVTGKPVKTEFGEWILPYLKIIARMRTLRGTRLDIFGRTEERKMERQLIDEYESMIKDLSRKLNVENYAEAVEAAVSYGNIKGFGRVKQEKFNEVQESRQQLTA